MRLKLTVAYDGTDFKGWASQKNHRTVHGTLTEAVRQVSGDEKIEIIGASRTDGGAHAKGQVCHFDCRHPIPVERWTGILNQVLPSDLAVVNTQQVGEDFNCRFMVLDRFYRYRILCGKRDPHRERFAHHYSYSRKLNIETMQQAATLLQGSHDFLAFTEELESSEINTMRTMFKVEVKQVRDEVWVDVLGTAFLRGMMRRMAGVILETGRGQRDIVEVSRLLDIQERHNLQWPVVLPAKGLCLMKIRYGRHPRDHRTVSSDSNL
jgi:tRNA pseudouridine38-40 synthase